MRSNLGCRRELLGAHNLELSSASWLPMGAAAGTPHAKFELGVWVILHLPPGKTGNLLAVRREAGK